MKIGCWIEEIPLRKRLQHVPSLFHLAAQRCGSGFDVRGGNLGVLQRAVVEPLDGGIASLW